MPSDSAAAILEQQLGRELHLPRDRVAGAGDAAGDHRVLLRAEGVRPGGHVDGSQGVKVFWRVAACASDS